MRSFLRLGLSLFLFTTFIDPPTAAAAQNVDITVNPAYTVSWLGGEVRLSRDVAAYVRIDNLANATYEGVLGYPALPRSVVAGARFNIAAGR
jgi:hypothetical protein